MPKMGVDETLTRQREASQRGHSSFVPGERSYIVQMFGIESSPTGGPQASWLQSCTIREVFVTGESLQGRI